MKKLKRFIVVLLLIIFAIPNRINTLAQEVDYTDGCNDLHEYADDELHKHDPVKTVLSIQSTASCSLFHPFAITYWSTKTGCLTESYSANKCTVCGILQAGSIIRFQVYTHTSGTPKKYNKTDCESGSWTKTSCTSCGVTLSDTYSGTYYHDWVYVGTYSGYRLEKCSYCGITRERK